MSLSYSHVVSTPQKRTGTLFFIPLVWTCKLILKHRIDILSSKVVFTNQTYDIPFRSGQGQFSDTRQFIACERDEAVFPAHQSEHTVVVHGGAANSGSGGESSKERSIRAEPFGRAAGDVSLDAIGARQAGIRRTVEFDVEVSESKIEARSPSA